MSDFYEENNASANDMLEQIIKETEHYPMALNLDTQKNIKLLLQELKTQRDRVDILEEQAKIYEANIKKYQESMMYYMEAKKKAELKLASYEDKTYINEDFLIRNGFEKRIITNGKPTLPSPTYLYCDEVEEITAKCIDAEMGVWYVSIGFLDSSDSCESLAICTIGQMRMFFAIEGLTELANQLKS